jgi:hypothetical protein
MNPFFLKELWQNQWWIFCEWNGNVFDLFIMFICYIYEIIYLLLMSTSAQHIVHYCSMFFSAGCWLGFTYWQNNDG